MTLETDQAQSGPRRRVSVPVKGRDCWWTVLVVDPIAISLVRWVARVKFVTPNTLTAISVVLALGAATAYCFDRLVIGALLFQASFVADCMDGKLAAIRRVNNPYGPFIDTAGDALRFTSCTGAIVFTLASGHVTTAGWITILAMFPTLHYARVMTQAAWPDSPKADPVVIGPSPLDAIRTAPSRLSKPATTVDTEALAFTVGPVLGLPLEGILAATLIDGSRMLISLVTRLRRSTREARLRSDLEAMPDRVR